MADTTTAPNRQATDYETIIEQDFTEIRRLNEIMLQDRMEINRLRSESQRHKLEGELLRQEALSILSRLQQCRYVAVNR